MQPKNTIEQSENSEQTGQGAMEYLLIISGAVLVAAIVLMVLLQSTGTGKEQIENAQSSYETSKKVGSAISAQEKAELLGTFTLTKAESTGAKKLTLAFEEEPAATTYKIKITNTDNTVAEQGIIVLEKQPKDAKPPFDLTISNEDWGTGKLNCEAICSLKVSMAACIETVCGKYSAEIPVAINS